MSRAFGFIQGGKELTVKKATDSFSARLKHGTQINLIVRAYPCDCSHRLPLQDLVEFTVDPSKCDEVMADVRQSDDVEFVSHVYTPESDPNARLYLTDEITVEFDPKVTDEEIAAVCSELGLELVKPVAGLKHVFVFRVTSQAKENPIKIANRILESDKVRLAEPNIAVASQRFYEPTDALFEYQWHLHHDGGVSLDTDSHIDVTRAWDVTRGDRSIVVAVADDSCDRFHADFQGQGKIVSPRDFAGLDFDPLPEGKDDNHGTACAGVAVAEENGQGVVGVGPGCALMPIRTSGFLDDNSIERLFEWVVEKGASVVSCSWGAAAIFFPLSLRKRNALHRAATLGRNGRGCVIVFAAGNANRPIDGVVDEKGWPNDVLKGPTHWLDGFSTHEDVIAVSACTSLARRSTYSNWGEAISACAPSNNAHPGIGKIPTYPLVTSSLPGRGVVTTDRVGPSGYSSSDYTFGFGGTSSACPVVAGVAALVLSANPDLTAAKVKEILETTADKIEDTNPDPQLGSSFGTYDGNGHSQWFGHGRVNAFNAVTEAVRRKGGVPDHRVREVSSPALAIPDDDLTGITDTIVVLEVAIVSSVRVRVEITHPYVGDLRLVLTSPSGSSVVLHDRQGGRTQDLRKEFDLTSAPGLGAMVNQSTQGAWTLHVQDLAPIDKGQLDRWELEIDVLKDALVELEDVAGITIPDDAPAGIERTLRSTTSGSVKAVEVSVDITHTYIRDLVVELVSPSGTGVSLHNRTGGAAHNIIKTYSAATTSGLQALAGEKIAGIWRLRVSDHQGLDKGKLSRWALRVFRTP